MADSIIPNKNHSTLLLNSIHEEVFLFLYQLLFITAFCNAQVAVRNEPRHHNIFENAYVRLLDVHIAPGDTTLFHIHQTPSVFIMLSNVKSGSEVKSEDSNDKKLIGNSMISFTGFYHQPRIHRVWNSDTAGFHVMDVELLNGDRQAIDPPLIQNGLQLLFDEQPVRGYMLALDDHTGFNIKGRKAPVLIVNLTDNDIIVNEKLFHKKGDFIFVSPHSTISFSNIKTVPVRLAVLELK